MDNEELAQEISEKIVKASSGKSVETYIEMLTSVIEMLIVDRQAAQQG